jgi:putative intracellular protease/amidase
MTKKVLMVLTSHDQLGETGQKTGFWVEEFAAPYYTFVDAGVEVTLATPNGGQAPIDPTSTLADFQTAATQRFDKDDVAQAQIASTKILASLSASNFDAVFYPGGHGPLWDLTENNDSINLIEDFLKAGKGVATVCHASAALLNVKNTSGEFAVKGKAVTGFTNSEEAAVQLTEVVPFFARR